MPAHDYQCDSCRHTFEEIAPIKEHERIPKRPCPVCGKKAVRRLFLHAPAIKTAATWLSRHGTLLDHFGDSPEGRSALEYRVEVARRNGYNPSPNDVYDETVALYPGDPEGFIPHDDPAGHIRRVCERRGVSCDSDLAKVKAREVAPPSPAPLADDLVTDLAAEKIKENPDLAARPKTEIAEMIRDKHSYQTSK